MSLKCCIMLLNMPNRLKTLVLSHMEIYAEVLGCFLQSRPFLEKLRLCNISSLGSIRASDSLLSLQHLDISNCQPENIDILAPKLFTFKYHGCNIELNIQNALLLSDMSIGSDKQQPTHAYKSLSEYFPQLEYLHVRSYRLSMEKLVLPQVSNLTNIKHLKLTVTYSFQSLLEWMPLIEASPVLHNLTLKLTVRKLDREMTLENRTSLQPLKCMRTLEVYGFEPLSIEIEFVTRVIENALALEELFIDLKGGYDKLNVEIAEAEFKHKLPIGAKLVINNRYKTNSNG